MTETNKNIIYIINERTILKPGNQIYQPHLVESISDQTFSSQIIKFVNYFPSLDNKFECYEKTYVDGRIQKIVSLKTVGSNYSVKREYPIFAGVVKETTYGGSADPILIEQYRKYLISIGFNIKNFPSLHDKTSFEFAKSWTKESFIEYQIESDLDNAREERRIYQVIRITHKIVQKELGLYENVEFDLAESEDAEE
jgi:hypothetical protein